VKAAAAFHDGAPVDADDVAPGEVFADDGERALVGSCSAIMDVLLQRA